MKSVSCSISIAFTMFSLCAAPLGAWAAIPAITCHCFTDRSYDPARPTIADPYFLATTQNSFFAAVFAVEKKSIVLKKQKGTANDDLWIGYWLAAKSGADPEKLLQERKNKGSWQKIVASLSIPNKSMESHVASALKSRVNNERLAEAMVDELLVRFHMYGETELAALRKAGVGNQEVILTALLASKLRQPAMQLYSGVKKGNTSWGALLQQAKIDPPSIEAEIESLVKGAATSKR